MADDKISKRLDALEEETESQVRDLIITCVTEQHVRVGDELVVVKREPSGYSEIEWGSFRQKNGGRIGVRYARYIDEGDDPGNWNQNIPKTLSTDAGEPDADHRIVLDPEVTGD
jgi:hypothetical protein